MCRFLIVRTSSPLDPRGLMSEFAEMARLSRAPDGDRQADGWGVAWQAPGSPIFALPQQLFHAGAGCDSERAQEVDRTCVDRRKVVGQRPTFLLGAGTALLP